MLPSDVYNSACSTTPKGPTCPEGSGPDYDFGSPAILVSTTGGRELLLAGQKSGVVWAFDPDKNGEVMWETRVGQGGINGGVQWGMASDGEQVYAAASDAVATRTATARILDPKVGGGLTRAADRRTAARSGAPRPRRAPDRPNCSPAQSAALTAIPGVVFSGSLDGHLRAYSTRDGAVLWDVDTIRSYDTVNGVKASWRRDRRTGRGGRRRDGVRQFRLHAIRRAARKRAPRLRGAMIRRAGLKPAATLQPAADPPPTPTTNR